MTEKELKELNENLSSQLAELETKLEKAVDDNLETKTASLVQSIEKITKQLEEVELKMNRPGFDGGEEKKSAEEIEKKEAFDGFLRKGLVSEEAIEKKYMSVSDDVSGGYLASEEMANEIIRPDVEMSNMSSLAFSRTTSKKSVLIPIKKQAMTAHWVGEGKAPADSELKFGLKRLPVNKLVAIVIVTDEDLEDSDFNLEAEIIRDAREQFDVAEGKAFVTGDGIEKPFGILTDTEIAETETAAVGVVAADDLIDLFYDVKTVYSNAPNAAYMMNRQSLKVVRKLKDSTGDYLFRPAGSLKDKPFATLNGALLIEDPEMPDIAEGSTPIMFGDVRKAYTIVRRKDVTIVRDNLTLASEGKVKFVITKRITGRTVLSEAVVKLKVKSS